MKTFPSLIIAIFLFSATFAWADPTELNSDAELMDTVRQFSAAVLFLGHGSKSQIANVGSTLAEVDTVVSRLNAQYGQGQWVAVFGGDPYSANKPDIAHVTKHLKETHGIRVMAIQSDVVIDWGGVDKYIDYVRYIPTVKVPVMENGKPVMENGEVKTSVYWGGFIEGKPAGPTGTYLGEIFIGGSNPILKSVVTVGGGPIALEEARYAYEKGIDVEYVRTETLYPEVNGRYGSVDSWVQSIKSGGPSASRCARLFSGK